MENNNHHLIGYKKQLNSLGPTQVLERGYSIAMAKDTKNIIRSAQSIIVGDVFSLQTGDGMLDAEKIS